MPWRLPMPESSWLQGASPGFRLMIATSWLAPASWQDKQEKAIREAIGAGLDWMEYLRLVDRHRTPALSWAALKRVPELKIPEPVKQQLQKGSDSCRMKSLKHSLLLVGALKALNLAGVAVMSLKGPILSYDLYGDVGLRQSHDLDLEVRQGDLFRAQACLENLGWRLDVPRFPLSLLSPRQMEAFLRHECHLSFVHPHGGYVLELHWRNQWDCQDQIAGRWARSIPSVWQGCSHQAMNPIDLVFYLCSHGGTHGWCRAKWLGDLARIHADGRMDWASALEEARRSGQDRFLLASLRLLQEVHGLPLPALAGNPFKNLPSFLIDHPLDALKLREDPGAAEDALNSLRKRFRYSRHDRMVLPRRSWREILGELAHCSEDFRTLRLPDRLFWAYTPLRPILWLWRQILRGRLVAQTRP